jgi:3',5'-cyclic AMP phosphodiesterase CpdA
MGHYNRLNIKPFFHIILVCLGINLFITLDAQAAGVSETELIKLDPFAKRYNVEKLIKKIQSIPFDPNKGFSFVAWGDVRSNRKVFTQLWDSINQESALFSIATGDLVLRGTVDEWLLDFFPIVDRHSKNIFLPVLGNHDIGTERVEYKRIFGVRDYYFDYGNARFIVIDNSGSGFSDEQLAWTENLLKTADNMLTFLFAHKPPKTIKKWAYHSFDQNADEFCNLMTQYKVTHVYLGHIHAYSTATFQGIDYSITGGGGAGLHNRYGPLGNVHHYTVVRVDEKGIQQEVVRVLDGKLVRGEAGNTFYQTPEEMLLKHY